MQSTRVAALLTIALLTALSAGLVAQTATAPAPKATPSQLLVREVSYPAMAKQPLMRALRSYEELSGLTVEADWNGLKAVGVTKETPVTLKAGKLPFEKLLDVTLNAIAPENHPLAWYMSGSTVTVSTQARIILRNRLTTAMPVPARAARPADNSSAGAAAAGKTPLTVPKEYSFSESPLKLVLEFLQEVAQVNFHVNWKAMEATGISKDTPVTLKAKDISIGRALDLVLDQVNGVRDRRSSLYWVVNDGVVEIATGEALDQTTSIRVLEVGDLLMTVPNFIGPDISIASGTGGNGVGGNGASSGGIFGGGNTGGSNSSSGEETSPAELRKQTADTLIEIIKLSIGEDMWEPTGKGSVRLLRDKLIISQTPLGFKLLEKATGGGK